MEVPRGEYDLAVAWTWEYDREFVAIVESVAMTAGLRTLLITPQNVGEVLQQLQSGQLRVRVLLDRASDEDESFHPLHRFLAGPSMNSGTSVVNLLDRQQHAADKATMHLEFLSHGLAVPYTIILPPYAEIPDLRFSEEEIQKIGRPFVIKPANTTGGGIGVVRGAKSLEEVLETRKHHKNDKYLLQETVRPAYLSENRAWFRVIYAFDDVFSCWWDDQTHVYEEVTPEEAETYGLHALAGIARAIHGVCKLEFFSTEIAYTTGNRYVVVDYVNEICDMRPKSAHRDGVPDRLVRSVAEALIRFVRSRGFAG